MTPQDQTRTQDTTPDRDPLTQEKPGIGMDRLAAEWTKRAGICHAKAQASDNVMDSRWLVGEAEAYSRAASELRQSQEVGAQELICDIRRVDVSGVEYWRAEDTRRYLSDVNVALAAERASHAAQLADCQDKLAQAEADVATMDKTAHRLTAELAAKDAEIARLKATHSELASLAGAAMVIATLIPGESPATPPDHALTDTMWRMVQEKHAAEAEISRLKARERDGWREGIDAAITVLMNLDAKVVSVDGVPTQNIALVRSTINEALFRIRRVRDRVVADLASRQEPPK